MRLRPLIAAILGALLSATTVQAASLFASPRQMDGFKTCADVAKAESEAQLVVYSTDPEDGSERVLARFRKMFPKISTSVYAAAGRRVVRAYFRGASGEILSG